MIHWFVPEQPVRKARRVLHAGLDGLDLIGEQRVSLLTGVVATLMLLGGERSNTNLGEDAILEIIISSCTPACQTYSHISLVENEIGVN